MNELVSKKEVIDLMESNRQHINAYTYLTMMDEIEGMATYPSPSPIYTTDEDIEPVSKEFLEECHRTAQKYKKKG